MTRKPTRINVDKITALRLWVMAGGRCSFPGCNQYLLHDTLTKWPLLQGHIAHIVAASEDGPRGQDPLPLIERNNIENLILVCQDHHRMVDNDQFVDKFPIDLLRKYKQDHEDQIFELTGCTPDKLSTVVRFLARIGSEKTSASYSNICEALFQQGRYPRHQQLLDVDLTQFPQDDSAAFIQLGTALIDDKLRELYNRHMVNGDTEHVSVFAIGSIPLLIYLGSRLSNKVPTALYQRHRDTQDWRWKDEPPKASYEGGLIQEGTTHDKVALILSLSGKIHLDQLPQHIKQDYFVYEIQLASRTPDLNHLRTPQDLEQFQGLFHEFLSEVRAQHPTAKTVHLFPAVPSPVAITCGRELLHKIKPSLSVYDSSIGKGGFEFILEVN